MSKVRPRSDANKIWSDFWRWLRRQGMSGFDNTAIGHLWLAYQAGHRRAKRS